MYEIRKSIKFAAAHFAISENAGQRHNMHGHTYEVELCVSTTHKDPETGFSVPYSVLSSILKHDIHNRYDHKCLNDLPEFAKDSSTEEIAHFIYVWVKDSLNESLNFPHALVYVKVSESNEASTTYYP